MRRRVALWVVLGGIAAYSGAAQATEDSILWSRPQVLKREEGGVSFAPRDSASLSPREAFTRTQAVLEHFGAPRGAGLEVEPGLQTAEGFAAVAKLMDPSGFFRRFVSGAPSGGLDVFQDLDSREVADFSYAYGAGVSERYRRLHRPRVRPLEGLRVALDPGHMGGDAWDRHTGKFVRDRRGRKLSEGTMALQVALLLERDLQALGAEVMLTHREEAPVTEVAYDGMDLRPYALAELAETTQAGWFQNQIRAAAGPTLFAAMAANPSFKALFDPGFYNHDTYFILREDLDARARKIEAFDADISLVIHFDTSSPPGDSQGVGTYPNDFTKAYVVGSYSPVELSSREARRYFFRHALDAGAWDDSLALGRAIVGRLHRDLGLPFDRGGGGTSAQVEPGIFSRNLGVSRRVTGRALTYLEVLYYNDPREFEALTDFRYAMDIGGRATRYSERLVQVERAILAGVQDFAAGAARGP